MSSRELLVSYLDIPAVMSRILHTSRFVLSQRVIMKLSKLHLIRKFFHMKDCWNYIGSKSIQPIPVANFTIEVSPIKQRFFTIMINKKNSLNNQNRHYKIAVVLPNR